MFDSSILSKNIKLIIKPFKNYSKSNFNEYLYKHLKLICNTKTLKKHSKILQKVHLKELKQFNAFQKRYKNIKH